MKAVIQRVVNASVAVDGRTISSIGKGLLVLIGIDKHDEPSDSTSIIKKILSARLFEDESGEGWKSNIRDIDGEILCVSQFTLLATFKGSKPDFHDSMSTIPGRAYYTSFLEEIRSTYQPQRIKDGQFGAMMQVSLTNDGPVTILLSSRDKPSKSVSGSGSGSGTPAQADEMRQKQKEMADAKAKKRQAAEARVKEKELAKKQKEEEWSSRNGVRPNEQSVVNGANGANADGAEVNGTDGTGRKKAPLTTEQTLEKMEKLDLHSTSTST